MRAAAPELTSATATPSTLPRTPGRHETSQRKSAPSAHPTTPVLAGPLASADLPQWGARALHTCGHIPCCLGSRDGACHATATRLLTLTPGRRSHGWNLYNFAPQHASVQVNAPAASSGNCPALSSTNESCCYQLPGPDGRVEKNAK